MEESWSKEKQEAEEYARMMERYAKYEIIPLAKKIAEDIPSKDLSFSLADIGSGPGLLSIELAKRLPNATITAVDFSRVMLDIAERKAKENNVTLEVMQSDIQNIEIADEHFDVILNRHTIHEVDNPVSFLKETFRLLKPGGNFFLIDFSGDHPSWKLRPLWLLIRIRSGKKSADGFWKSHKAGLKMDAVVKMCKEAGYASVNAGPYGYAFYLNCQK